MATTTDPSFDFVCVPGAIAPGERVAHFVLGYRLFAKLAEERIDLPSGIALRLAAENFSEVARFVANERASSWLPADEYGPGIDTPWTFSAPSALTAIAATTAESMPPLNPSTADLKPHLWT